LASDPAPHTSSSNGGNGGNIPTQQQHQRPGSNIERATILSLSFMNKTFSAVNVVNSSCQWHVHWPTRYWDWGLGTPGPNSRVAVATNVLQAFQRFAVAIVAGSVPGNNSV